MGIRPKILLMFVLCFGVMAGVSLFLLKQSMDESYANIERGDIAANMGRVEQSFEASAASLKNQTNDWSVWNEMYRYALKPNPAWVKENIGDDAPAPADISMAMVFGKNGNLLSASSVTYKGAKLKILMPQLTPYLELIKNGTRQARCGIIRIDAGLMMVCWAGIVQSDASGEVVGTVVMGRMLDSSRLSKLREQTRLPFDLEAKPELPEGLTRWSGMLSPGTIGSGDFWTSYDPDVYHLYYPVQDILKQEVGLIKLDVARSVHKQGLMLYQQVRQQLVLTVLVMTVLLGLALHFMLIRRLSRFAKQIDVLETQSTWDARIDIGGKDELGLVATNFNKLLALIKSQMAGLRELLEAKESALKVIQATQAQLILSEKDALQGKQRVSNLLNNSGQGFLSFGGDLLIDPEISRACETMLGCSPAGRNVAQVFVGDDPVKTDLFCAIIPAVLAEADPDIRESMLSLLPAEISRNDVLLKAEYKLLEGGRFMAVLTDITEERRLESMLQSERLRLELIVLAVSDTRNFFDAIDAFREFLSHRLPRMLDEAASPEILSSCLGRELHTYKGLLNQFGLIHTPKVLHEIETCLSDVATAGDTLTRQSIVDTVAVHVLQSAFDKDLAVLSDALGTEFLAHGRSIVLSSDQVLRLEKFAVRLLQGEVIDASAIEIRTLLNEVVALRKVTLNVALKNYDGLVRQAAKRLGKQVAPIEVLGGTEIWVDPQSYQAFLHALGHVFRNAVVHGLESPEDRWAAAKKEAGKISCHVTLEGRSIKLSIADDGSGVDLDALRKRAVEAGIYTADEILVISDDEIASLVFRDRMSTRGTVTELSGRGVGLAAVLSETQKLGGEVVVRSATGQGTQFLFTLPLRQNAVSSGLMAFQNRLTDEIELVMRAIIAKTRNYFESEHEIGMTDAELGTGERESLALLDTTVIIGLGGRVNLWVAFSLQKSLVDAVYTWMAEGINDHPDDQVKYRDAAAGELVNTIVGHCTMDIQHLDRRGISITPPIMLGRGGAIPGVSNATIFTQGLNTTLGRLNISIVGPRELFDTPLN